MNTETHFEAATRPILDEYLPAILEREMGTEKIVSIQIFNSPQPTRRAALRNARFYIRTKLEELS